MMIGTSGVEYAERQALGRLDVLNRYAYRMAVAFAQGDAEDRERAEQDFEVATQHVSEWIARLAQIGKES